MWMWVCTMGIMEIPEEPEEIRKFIRSVRSDMGEGDDIDWDSFSVWAMNKLPKYLWDSWKAELRKRGINWQGFLKILRLHTKDAIEWALRGQLSWEEFMRRLISTVDLYSVRDDRVTRY